MNDSALSVADVLQRVSEETTLPISSHVCLLAIMASVIERGDEVVRLVACKRVRKRLKSGLSRHVPPADVMIAMLHAELSSSLDTRSCDTAIATLPPSLPAAIPCRLLRNKGVHNNETVAPLLALFTAQPMTCVCKIVGSIQRADVRRIDRVVHGEECRAVSVSDLAQLLNAIAVCIGARVL